MWLPGDPIPEFVGSTAHNPRYTFYTTAGRYVVLSFLGSAGIAAVRGVVGHVERRRALFDDEHLCFFGVLVDPEDEARGRVRTILPGIRYFRDFDRSLSRRSARADSSVPTRTTPRRAPRTAASPARST